MLLGRKVDLGPGDIALDRDPAPLKGAQDPPLCGPCVLWPKGWMDEDATCYRGRPQPRPHCVRWGPSSPLKGVQQLHPLFGRCLLWPNGRPSQLLLITCISVFSTVLDNMHNNKLHTTEYRILTEYGTAVLGRHHSLQTAQ